MMQLVLMMIERVGLIVILGFFLVHMKFFKQYLQDSRSYKGKIVLIFIFSLFCVISNYTGVEIQGTTILTQDFLVKVDPSSAIANTRIMGITIGGLLGGPIVGLAVGFIAGIHRYFLGGSAAFTYAISSIVAGALSGYIGFVYRKRNELITPSFASLVGVCMESLQMLIILLLVKPFSDAWMLVQIIAVPMILVNGSGSYILLSIIQSILKQEEHTKALQTQKVLLIADQTLPYFRQGLTEASCMQVAKIIQEFTGADAISLTNEQKILAHVGAGSDHHIPSYSLITGLSKTVLKTGEIKIATKREEIKCENKECPLHAAIVLPLITHERTIGTLKLYFTKANRLSLVEKELAEGLAKLFSTQLELGEAELQSKLLKDAEIKALQAQVNPHFLFNAINTISALCRTDVEKARKLLIQLSVYFRSNLQGARHLLIPLEKEINLVKSYLSLEQARFPSKYQVEMYIEDGLENILLPPFAIQVLVENALRHAFPRKQDVCKIEIFVKLKNNQVHVKVKDNGKGIEKERLEKLGHSTVVSEKGTGTALHNINQRLIGLFGKETTIYISSVLDQGTEVFFTIPIQRENEGELDVTGINS